MQYMLLIYGNEAGMKSATDADRDAMFRAYREYTQGLIKSGNMKAGDALQPTATAAARCRASPRSPTLSSSATS